MNQKQKKILQEAAKQHPNEKILSGGSQYINPLRKVKKIKELEKLKSEKSKK